MEFQDAKQKVSDIPGRRFDWDTKLWILPADPAIAERVLKTIRPDADQEILNWITASKATAEESLTSPLPVDQGKLLIPWAYSRAPWQPETVNDEKVHGLLPHQRPAVLAIAERGRALLADDVGLGKSLIALSAIEEFKLRNGQMEGPSLIAAPASVQGGWVREINRWLENPNVVNVEGRWPHQKRADYIKGGIEENAHVVVNLEQLRIEKTKRVVRMRNGGTRTVTDRTLKQPLLGEAVWLAAVLDEVHRIKNPKALITQGAWRIEAQLKIGATATALMNSPDELWAILRWLWPDQYHELGRKRNAVAYWTFYQEHVDYWEDHYKRKVVTGVKNPDALRFVLKDKLIRRTASVLKLKGRKRIYVDIDLNTKQRQLYDEAETSMWLAVQEESAAGNRDAIEFATKAVEGDVVSLFRIPNGAARTVRLRQVIENSALLGGADDSAGMDDFEARFEGSGFQPWVVFCEFKASTELLAERLRKKFGVNVGVYHGDVPASKRTEMEDAFQRGELDVMVGTIGAMKEGITLTRSHLMYFLSRAWVPDVNEQCEGREDRIGQQELVRVYIAQAADTVATNKVEPTNRVKEGIVRTVVDKIEIKEEHA